MTTRGQITDKWHRVCKQCGTKVHINAIRGVDTYECEQCGHTYFTRDRSKVSA
jgi:DNA-directed RNA polymerase subunit RPC12/RpoP